MVDLSVVFQRRVPTVQTVQKTDEFLKLQFLDLVDMPVIVHRQVRSLRGDVVDIPVVAQRQIPMVRFPEILLLP